MLTYKSLRWSEGHMFLLCSVKRTQQLGGRSCWKLSPHRCWNTCVTTQLPWRWTRRPASPSATSWRRPVGTCGPPWRLWLSWPIRSWYQEGLKARCVTAVRNRAQKCQHLNNKYEYERIFFLLGYSRKEALMVTLCLMRCALCALCSFTWQSIQQDTWCWSGS